MKTTIWKFPLRPESTHIEMPSGAKVLCVQSQFDEPFIWAEVNPNESFRETRFFETFGTGHDIPNDMGIERSYIGTFQLKDGMSVFHCFERIN